MISFFPALGYNTVHWKFSRGIAKLHWILIPACEGSNPSSPAIPFATPAARRAALIVGKYTTGCVTPYVTFNPVTRMSQKTHVRQ